MQVDIAKNIIDKLTEQHKDIPGLTYAVGDCRDMPEYMDCQFGGVLDKGAAYVAVCVCARLALCLRLCACVRLCARNMCVCMRACAYACVCLWMCMCMSISVLLARIPVV